MAVKLVTVFDKEDQSVENLGGKGFGLWQMQKAGINVPPAIIIPTTVCQAYMVAPEITMAEVKASLVPIQDFFIDQLGYMPLVSVRSGARVSMPGMMDTVLNVGLDPVTYPYWKDKLGEACVENCYDRLHEMYGATVLGLKDGKQADLPLAADQLLASIEAVFKSWNSERAVLYRKEFGIPDDWGTAVTIQAMVFGNYNANSGSGVLLTRNVDTGDNKPMINFGIQAQGEDVVAGKVAGVGLAGMDAWNIVVTSELLSFAKILEKKEKDAMDIEFTIQDGKLYILQKRVAKRNAQSAVKIAVDLFTEGVITKKQLFKRVSRRDFDLSQLPVVDPAFKEKAQFTGTGASSGVAYGVVVHTAEAAINCQKPCILVTKETNPDDFGGMVKAQGVLTMEGGYTSHAALVARSLNKPCVVGLSTELLYFPEGMEISIDGATGRVWAGKVPVIAGGKSESLQKLLEIMWGEVGAGELDGDAPEYITLEGHYLDKPEDAAAYLTDRAALVPEASKVYIDLRGTTEELEIAFYTAFLEEGLDHAQPLIDALAKELDKDTEMKERVRLVTFADETHDIKTVTPVTDLESLVMADGEVIMGKLGSKNKAIAKVLEWQKGKLTPLSVGKVVANAKSFITESDLVVKLLA